MSTKKTVSALIGASLIAMAYTGAPVMADEENLADAFKNGKIIFDLRARYENVDQEGFDVNAKAATTRIRAGFETAKFNGFALTMDFESIEGLTDKYNSTTNGMATYPVVADPDGTEINQFKLAYTGIEKTTITAGRQVIALGNQRFIGHVGFRQNQQTFDAITLVNSTFENLTIVYGFVDKVHRIFGNDHPAGNLEANAHAVNIYYSGLPWGKVSAYGYSLGVDAVPGLNSQTIGMRWDGNQKINDSYSLVYGGEYAEQRDHLTNPGDYKVKYYSLDAAVKNGGLMFKAAYEKLGGDGTNSFKTPLATLHKFQGFADAFLNTPANGVKDYWGQVAYTKKVDDDIFKSFSIAAFYHDFKSVVGSTNMGKEIDVSITTVFNKGLSANIKIADYKGKGFQADRTKIWFTLGFKY